MSNEIDQRLVAQAAYLGSLDAHREALGANADTRLVALAPELLAALRNLLNATEDTLREHVETGCCYVTHQRCNEARALIAKATELPPDVRCGICGRDDKHEHFYYGPQSSEDNSND